MRLRAQGVQCTQLDTRGPPLVALLTSGGHMRGAAAAARLVRMDDELTRELPEEPPVRPETDLQEGNARSWTTEDLPGRAPRGTSDGLWIDPVDGPVVLP